MRYIPTQVVFVLNRVQRRLTQARPGSVLIMVVVLVVLLALMGTALLTTTRGDRYVSSQNTANTQIDLLVDGVVQQVKSAIVDDLYGTVNNQRAYRPAWDSGTISNASLTTGAYMHWDMPNIKPDDPAATPPYVAADHPQDMWLAPRLPSIHATWDFAIPQGTPDQLYWSSISMLPGVTKFDAPFTCAPTSGRPIDTSLSTIYTTRVSENTVRLIPNFVQPRGYSQTFPAWFLASVGGFVLAADADGDGIADAGYVKIPVGELDGLTYYYAIRVIDNNSAINVNTAWSRAFDVETPVAAGPITLANLRDAFGNPWTATTNNLGMFRSHVGLYELLHPDPGNSYPAFGTQTDKEMQWLNGYRFGNNGTDGFANSATIIGESGSPRNDFAYVTQGDMLEHTLANRIDNPGKRQDTVTGGPLRMAPFGTSDAGALAYHFVLGNLDASTGIENAFEQTNLYPTLTGVPDSVHRSSGNFPDKNNPKQNKSSARGRRSYRANEVGDWVYDNFNWENLQVASIPLQQNNAVPTPNAHPLTPTYRSSIRSILTTYNPVSNLIPQRDPTIPAGALPAMPDYGAKYGVTPPNIRRLGTKTNINTAKFEELWRAFWCVMAESNGESPFTAVGGADNNQGTGFTQGTFMPDATSNPQRMFRSSIRDPMGSVNRPTIPSKDMVQIRAAAAAVQAMQMRQPLDTLGVKKQFAVTDLQTQGGYQLKMFGASPQPFITEVFVWYDPLATNSGGLQNTAPYIAIELYNPFDYPVEINNLKIKYWQREAGVPNKNLIDTGITFTGDPIEPKHFILIDNFSGSDADPKPHVMYYPPSSKLDAGLPNGLTQSHGYYSVPGLTDVVDNEMVITRTVNAVSRTGAIVTDEQPVDSFDFSGFPAPDAANQGEAFIWHYVRRTSGGNQVDGRWACVYPGRYDTSATKGFTPDTPRQQGTEVVRWDAGGTDPWDGGSPSKAKVTLGADNPDSNLPSDPSNCHEFVIPLPDRGSPGPNPLGTGNNHFPFGMFARDGDMLQVPFIASYVVTQGGVVREMNSISMDAAFAEDTDIEDDAPLPSDPTGMREQIGHFCPIAMKTNSGTVDDFDDSQTATKLPLQRYAWARKLFDYLTVQSPASDYTPNVSPDVYTAAGGTLPEPVSNTGALAAQEDGTNGADPARVGVEDAVPVQGLININTAPWIVLSALPWVPAGQDKFKFDPVGGTFKAEPDKIDDNIDIAKAIAYWRDGEPTQFGATPKGPFRSIFDLYKVEDASKTRVFDFINKTQYGQNTEPGYADGEFSSYIDGDMTKKDGVRYDFKEQYLLMTKVSNLITTRSDSFTVYILVQGWRGVGGNHPELVVQRRVAFIQDRSPITCTNTVLPSSVNVPTD